MKEKKYHYFYKITNNINGKYYYGVHNTNNLNDNYWGSGKRIKAAIKKYGIDNFTKEIVKQFDTWKEAFDYEESIVTEDLLKDPMCYNIQKGGLTGGVEAIDRRKKEIFKDHQRGKKNSQYNTCWITKDKINKKIKRFELSKYVKLGWSEGRYIKSENIPKLIGIYKDDQYIKVKKSELESYLKNGWLINSRINSVAQQGLRNSQFGTKWVHKGKEQLKIKEDLLEEYISSGWKLGQLKYKWINNGKKNTRVVESEYEQYIANGWNKGKLK